MTKRKNLTKKVRFEVFKRDNFTCQYCGKSAPDVVLNADHIKPVAKGGTNELINLVTSCFDCNSGKKDRELSDNSEIKAQSKELKILAKKREQLEFLMQWRDELRDLDRKEAEYVISIINDELSIYGHKVTDQFEQKISKLVKKHGANLVIESIEASKNQYFDGPETASNFVDMIPKICFYKSKGEQTETNKQVFYIRAVIRNRYNYINDRAAIVVIRNALENGAPFEYILDKAKELDNWTEFKEFCEEQAQ